MKRVFIDMPSIKIHASGKTFCKWLDEMKAAGLIENDREAAKIFDVRPNTITSMKENGIDKRTALACRALLHRLEPYN